MTQWTVTHQASLSMGFPRQEYWSGLPFPSPGDLPDLGIKLMSPALKGGFFTTEPLVCGSPQYVTLDKFLDFLSLSFFMLGGSNGTYLIGLL